MPANSTNAIRTNVDVDTYTPVAGVAAGVYGFSLQDATVRFRKIPANAPLGLQLRLPEHPSDGDEYEFVDADGSCSDTHIIEAVVPAGSGTTFQGAILPSAPLPLTLFAFASPNAGARFQYDEGANAWIVFQNPTTIFNTQDNYASLGNNGAENPGNFAGGAAINLFAFLVKPVGQGIFNLRTLLSMAVSAADAAVILSIELVTNVTAFTGGTLSGTGTAPSARFETGTGAGQPVVVTGDAPSVVGTWKKQIAVGEIGAQTASFSLDVNVPEQTNPLALGAAIVVTLADTAAQVTAMALNAAVQELVAGT